jgi:hypothetical protein
VATETAKFALELEDGISASTESAGDALQSLQAQIEKDSSALTQMKKAMRELQSGSSVDVSAYTKLKAEIDATQGSIGKARAAFVNLGGDFAKLGRRKPPKPPDVGDPKGLADMLGAANVLPGPLGQVSKGLGGVRSMVAGLTGAVGVFTAAALAVVAILASLVAVLGAVAVATAKATVELLKYAAAQADAMRSERLRLEGLGTLRRWMGLTAKDAAGMSESINRVSERVPLARSEIAGYGEELFRLGIRGNAAEDALEALSIAQAVQGERGRQRMMMLVRMAGHSEGAMRNLAERVRKELGGNAAAQMRSLSMISTKLRESFQALFSGVPIENLLGGLFRLTQLLSQNTESGRALRSILSSVLGVFIGDLTETTPILEYLFKELVILALKVAIAFFRIRNAITDAFGPHILGRLLASQAAADNFRIALYAAGFVAVVLAAGLVWLGLAAYGLVMVLAALGWALLKVFQAAQWLGAQLVSLVQTVFFSDGWIRAGEGMIDGIISGLTSGVTRLRAAVTGVATDALGAFRTALGIHSPSSVFAALGLAIPQGVAEGVERGSPEAEGSVRGMVSTTTNNVSRVQGGPSRAVTTGEIHIHVGEGEGGEDTARRVSDALREFFDNGLTTEMP